MVVLVGPPRSVALALALSTPAACGRIEEEVLVGMVETDLLAGVRIVRAPLAATAERARLVAVAVVVVVVAGGCGVVVAGGCGVVVRCEALILRGGEEVDLLADDELTLRTDLMLTAVAGAVAADVAVAGGVGAAIEVLIEEAIVLLAVGVLG